MERKFRHGIVRLAHVELKREVLWLLGQVELLRPVVRVRRDRHANLSGDARGAARPSLETPVVGVALLDHHLAVADLGIPAVHATVVDVNTHRPVLDQAFAGRGNGETRHPGEHRGVFELALFDEVVGRITGASLDLDDS